MLQFHKQLKEIEKESEVFSVVAWFYLFYFDSVVTENFTFKLETGFYICPFWKAWFKGDNVEQHK